MPGTCANCSNFSNAAAKFCSITLGKFLVTSTSLLEHAWMVLTAESSWLSASSSGLSEDSCETPVVITTPALKSLNYNYTWLEIFQRMWVVFPILVRVKCSVYIYLKSATPKHTSNSFITPQMNANEYKIILPWLARWIFRAGTYAVERQTQVWSDSILVQSDGGHRCGQTGHSCGWTGHSVVRNCCDKLRALNAHES